jgi:hypothetical protein
MQILRNFTIPKSYQFDKSQLELLSKIKSIDRNDQVQYILKKNEFVELESVLEKISITDFYTTEFIDSDYETDYFRIFPLRDYAYPQPEHNFEYKQITYDVKDYCHQCGSGLMQNSFFRLKNEPDWGKFSAFGLNWVFDSLFIKTDLWETSFKNLGIEVKPVLHSKTLEELKTVVQIIFPISKYPLAMDDYPYELCQACSRKKYTPNNYGYLPNFIDQNQVDKKYTLFATQEFFGTGARAFRGLVVNRKIFNLIKNLNLKDFYFVPMQPKNSL